MHFLRKKQYFLTGVLLLVLITGCLNSKNKPTKINKYSQRLDQIALKATNNLKLIPFDSLKIPRSIDKKGQLKGTPSQSWTSGFFPGTLWQLYLHSSSEVLKQAAIQWNAPIEKEKLNTSDHDIGFKIYCSFGNGWQATHLPNYKDICVIAARSLSQRYNPNVHAIKSWDHMSKRWKYPVIIDNMMNLELLFEATKFTRDSSFYYIANQHALTTLTNHFRKNNSSYHVIDYDPITGDVLHKNTHQGFSDNSAWSRGQAWGLYGFTVAYRYTKNKDFLAQAQKIATFFFTHPNLPDDFIPYWDFDAPNIPNEPRDVSAATVAASGLLELAKYDPINQKKYLNWAETILESLNKPKYQSNIPPFILNHSVGSIPGQFEVDVPIIYADYYYIEALRRMKNWSKLN